MRPGPGDRRQSPGSPKRSGRESRATFTFGRKVYAVGQVSLGRRRYSVGRAGAGQSLVVRFDPRQREWVFYAEVEGEEREIARPSPRGLDVERLTGLNPDDFALPAPIQLTLPCRVGG